MKSNFKPVLLLVVIAMVVPELLTGSSPVSSFLIGKRLSRATANNAMPTEPTFNPVWLGMSLFFTYFLLLIFIAGKKLPLILFFAVFFFILWLYGKILKRNYWLTQKNLMLFGIGNYVQNTILAILLALTMHMGLIERVATGIVALLLLTWLARKIKKSDAFMASVAQ